MHVPLVINRRTRKAIHRQLYDQCREGILSGRFRPGERVPSTRELATACSISRTTVTTAYEQLIAEGYFDTARGSGTFVCRALPDTPVSPVKAAAGAGQGQFQVRLSAYARRLAPAVSRTPVLAGTIDLSKGSPDFHQFPFRVWRRLIRRQVTPDVFDYAEHGAGNDTLRYEIARYVARSRAVICTSDQVIVVNGSQQALDLCARILIDPGNQVAVENPGYPGAHHLFAALGARIRAVPVDGEGIRVDRLPPAARLVHVTPSHQFPSGVSMSLGRRLELLEWARQRGAVIIEDDYDSEYRYSEAPLPALQGLSRSVPVVYVGTFSNVMFPGLRIGYAVLPHSLVELFARAKWQTDRHTTLLEQAALADFLHEGHLERHIRRMRRLYARRREVLIKAFHQHLGDEATISGDAAGTYVLVRFATGTVPARGKRRSVLLSSTERFYLTGAPPHEYIVRFSGISERAIREGVKRLAARNPPPRQHGGNGIPGDR